MRRIIALVKANIAKALTEVGASIAGTLGVVYLIAFFVAEQEIDLDASASFDQYFSAGQIGLPILSLSGIIFVALIRRKGAPSDVLAFILYLVFVGPIIATSIIIGLNPWFRPDEMTPTILRWLWAFYWILHGLWFLVLVSEPIVPSAQEVAVAQESRVNEIKAGAAGHGQ